MPGHIIRIRGCYITQTVQSFILFLVILYIKSHNEEKVIFPCNLLCEAWLGITTISHFYYIYVLYVLYTIRIRYINIE